MRKIADSTRCLLISDMRERRRKERLSFVHMQFDYWARTLVRKPIVKTENMNGLIRRGGSFLRSNLASRASRFDDLGGA